MAKGQATTMFQVPKVEEEEGGGVGGQLGRGLMMSNGGRWQKKLDQFIRAVVCDEI